MSEGNLLSDDHYTCSFLSIDYPGLQKKDGLDIQAVLFSLLINRLLAAGQRSTRGSQEADHPRQIGQVN